jgi:Mrp family chromosome partitioning ATPase
MTGTTKVRKQTGARSGAGEAVIMDRLNHEPDERERQAASASYTAMEAHHPADIWRQLRPLTVDQRRLARNRVVTQAQTGEARSAVDMLRTKVAQVLHKNGWTSLAVTSPTPGCGKTTLAVNLAFSLARQTNYRVVLMDLDLRKPNVGKLLGHDGGQSIENFLKGKSALRDSFLRFGENLAIGVNAKPVVGAAELLQNPSSIAALKSLSRQLKPDVLVFDLPPMLVTDDLLAFLPAVDAVMLVAAAEVSSIGEIDICERELAKHSNVVGVVLNKCRHGPDKYGY